MKVAMTIRVMTTLIKTLVGFDDDVDDSNDADDVVDDGDNIRRFVERQSVTFHPGPGGSCFPAD